MRVLSRLFRRLFLERLTAAYKRPAVSSFFGELTGSLARRRSLRALCYRRCARSNGWSTPSEPFAGPDAVLTYLSRYTHRVAIANSRLVVFDDQGVTFKWKDYRAKARDRQKVMTLTPGEFIRRFLIHVLPSRFHRIRHYGLFANGARADNLARARELLNVTAPQDETEPITETDDRMERLKQPCPCCGGPMIIIETFEPGHRPRAPPPSKADSP